MSLRQSPIALVYIEYIQIFQQLIFHIQHDMCDAPIFTTPPTSFTGAYQDSDQENIFNPIFNPNHLLVLQWKYIEVN